jgi:phosphatidylglycerol:prolipoprotein diacylglycerol transferase
VLAALAGAKLWLVVEDWHYFVAHPREIFALGTLLAGGVYYGGILAAAVVGALYARWFRLDFLGLGDVYAAPLALGHAVGRLACFAAGCCYGKPTALPWGVRFSDPYARALVGTPLGIPLHPTQLYEAAAEFLIFLCLLRLGRRQQFPGELLGTYAVFYGVARGAIEFLRGDPQRGVFAGGTFSFMQVVSVLLLALGVWLMVRGRAQTRAEHSPA